MWSHDAVAPYGQIMKYGLTINSLFNICEWEALYAER